jgi:hypothetical protein
MTFYEDSFFEEGGICKTNVKVSAWRLNPKSSTSKNGILKLAYEEVPQKYSDSFYAANIFMSDNYIVTFLHHDRISPRGVSFSDTAYKIQIRSTLNFELLHTVTEYGRIFVFTFINDLLLLPMVEKVGRSNADVKPILKYV